MPIAYYYCQYLVAVVVVSCIISKNEMSVVNFSFHILSVLSALSRMTIWGGDFGALWSGCFYMSSYC